MVSSTRTRPLWILKIHKRLNVNKFKKTAKWISEVHKEDVLYAIKGNPKKFVYQVTVETMENCETKDREKVIWVPDELAEATGEMFEEFEQNEMEISEISSISDDDSAIDHSEVARDIEKEYKSLCDSESFDPYAPDSDDDDDEDLLDTVDESKKEGEND